MLLCTLPAVAPAAPRDVTDRLLVKLAPGASEDIQRTLEKVRGRLTASGWDIPYLKQLKRTAGGVHVVRLPRAVPLDTARMIASHFRLHAEIVYVEPDRRVTLWRIPNDVDYAKQWALGSIVANGGAINAPGAWDVATGDATVTVAVVDTGILMHTDFDGRYFLRNVGGTDIPYGYDFIDRDYDGSLGTANDGDGRDSDPRDPGDWVTDAENDDDPFIGCDVRPSSWHGTKVAGIVAATTDNAIGMAGVDWGAKLLPVRVLGKCGGYLSDIFEAARWAAGLPLCVDDGGQAIPGCSEPPANAHPARVINFSLGAGGGCWAFEQDVIDDLRAAGVAVVAAAGNSASDAIEMTPAACDGVIAVAAGTRVGGLAAYSNFGSVIDITAPGGESPANPDGIYMASDSGTKGPANDNTFSFGMGTSMASPHVSGTLSLMLAANRAKRLAPGPADWLGPVLLESKLKASARAFPTGTGADCNTRLCGAGLLDAAAAVRAVSTLPVASADDQMAGLGSTVQLDGSASRDDGKIAHWQWQQLAGEPVDLTGANQAVASFQADVPDNTTLQFRLTVTDDVGLVDTTEVSILVSSQVPVLQPIGDHSLTLGGRIELTARASQADGNTPALSVSPLPTGASFTDHGDGSASFAWQPATAGTFNLTFTASNALDPAYSDSETVTIGVSAPVSATDDGGGGGGGASLFFPLAFMPLVYLRGKEVSTRGTDPTARHKGGRQ